MSADPNCPRCHGIGYFKPASSSLGRGLVCTCRIRNGKISIASQSLKLCGIDGECEASFALAKAEARIAELKRQVEILQECDASWNNAAAWLELSARAAAAEARIVTVRAEALEEAASYADYMAMGNRRLIDEASSQGKTLYRECAEDCEDIAAYLRALIPAGTSSCAAKDGEAGHA